MIKCEIAFLILHYNTIEDTIKAIDSIITNIKQNYVIVVVDNFSTNNTGLKLSEKYANNDDIKVIINKENYGFARGNNIGFKFIKENYDVDYIAMINNDTYLLDDNFMDIVRNEYKRSGFAVLGPKILLPNNKINPVQENLISLKEAISRSKRFKLMYIANLLYLQGIYDLAKKVYLKVTKTKVNSVYSEANVDKYMEDVVLHASFLIFSRKYIELFDGIDSRTFMYMEEKILHTRLKLNNLKSVYNPQLVIFHNEDSSTNSVKKSKRQKNIFLYKNAYDSSKILIEELKKVEKING